MRWNCPDIVVLICSLYLDIRIDQNDKITHLTIYQTIAGMQQTVYQGRHTGYGIAILLQMSK